MKKMKKQNPRIKEKIRLLNQPKEGENRLPLPHPPPPEECWVVKENRIGVFNVMAISLTYMDWEVYQQLIQNFLITGCQLSPDKSVFQYLAFSPLFEKVSKLEMQKQVPLYRINVTMDGKKKIVKITAEKIEVSKIVGAPKGAKIVGKDGKELKL